MTEDNNISSNVESVESVQISPEAQALKQEIVEYAGSQVQLLERIDNQARQITDLQRELEDKKFETTYFTYETLYYDEEMEKNLKTQIYRTEYKLKQTEKELENYKTVYGRLRDRFDFLATEREVLDKREQHLRVLRETINEREKNLLALNETINQEFQVLEHRKDVIQSNERSIIAKEIYLKDMIKENNELQDKLRIEDSRRRTYFYEQRNRFEKLANTNSLRFEREYNKELVKALKELKYLADYKFLEKPPLITRRNSF